LFFHKFVIFIIFFHVKQYQGIKVPLSLDWCAKYRHLVKPPVVKKVLAEGEEEAAPPAEEGEPRSVSDVIGEGLMFEDAGIGLPQEELYRLFVSMKKLSDDKNIKSIRFFGKILGTTKDYYIVETDLARPEEGGENPDAAGDASAAKPVDPNFVPMEKAMGVNKYIYFVATSLLGNHWTQLPDVSSEIIQASRNIKYYFTGNLKNEVLVHPPFPGTEQDYLRAQIARIAASTLVAPKGIFKLNKEPEPPAEDNPKPKTDTVDAYNAESLPGLDPVPAEEQKFEPDFELTNLANWVHIQPAILTSQGRVTLYKPPPKEGEEAGDGGDGGEKAPEPVEQVLPLLASLNLEQLMSVNIHAGAMSAWAIHKCQKALGSPIVVLRSLRWPGAYTLCKFAKGDKVPKFMSIYLGAGHKYSPVPFTPVFVRDVNSEYTDTMEIKEGDDPTPEQLQQFKEPPPPVKTEEKPAENAGEEGAAAENAENADE